uniref:TIR domain-containing protein n=1 Tax=Haemonchus contortus TaxID=6289 RepID=A0A7I4Z0Z8_HAECO
RIRNVSNLLSTSFHSTKRCRSRLEELSTRESKDTLETLTMLYSDNLERSDEWAKKALEYLKSLNRVKAVMIVEGRQSFAEDDTNLL